MDTSAAKILPAEELLFHDGLGDRLLVRDAFGKPQHESFLLRTELSAVPSFEFALNQRLDQLEQFDHPAFVRVRRIVRVAGPVPALSLISDCTGGARLSDVLAAMEKSSTRASVGAVLFVVREILEAVSALHHHGSGIAHGALAPERVVVNGKIRITDYVLGSAIEQLRFPAERYWKELRVAVPASAGASRLDRPADVSQIGMIALALFGGRPLRSDEHMANLSEALTELSLLPDPVKTWLLRMLHLDPRRAYVSAVEAAQALEEAITEANVRPTPLILSALGVRIQAASPAVSARAVQTRPPPPIVAVNKTALRAAPKQDPWNAHDVKTDRGFAGHSMSSGPHPARSGWFGQRLKLILKVGLLGASLAGVFTLAQYVPAPAMFSPTGTLAVESNPAGAAVLVDGQERGVTPLALKLKSGRHEVELHGGGKTRLFNVYISSGANVSQYVELRAPSPRARKTE